MLDSLPEPWERTDEWYNFVAPPKDVHVLVSIDEQSYQGGENGAKHPMVWYHAFDGGRAFYMELGHTPESYSEPAFLQLLWAGLRYAIGDNEVLDYGKATALRVPDEDRFSKTTLGGGLDEPTELTVLPDQSVLIGERKGGIQYYNPKDQSMTKVAQFEVYHHTLHTQGVNVEMGLMGLQAAPDYAQSHWVYVYYSPVDTSVDRLSRFQFKDGQFDKASEEVILEVKTRREICCHTGGSIAFDGKDNLYLSVGDNTTPFDEKNPQTGKAYPINSHGYAPLDERPGFEHYDDRRAAGNSNDLRGKILRIHVNADGTYTIPQGNLFAEGTAKTRPEIYVMGDRNPYRITVDQHTGYLYWGEVGPDAANDSLDTRGPKGYDEINQARKAGNFGWPYFVGNNYPYHEYDYATGTPGPAFDPEHVVNNSRNNTGLQVLPPAQPAFIWYPYSESPDFPILGKGGRCAMAGPVYYVQDYPDSSRFPRYYDGKLFVYDWIRNWVMVVTMNQQGDLQTIEPFMPHTRFHSISDMEIGPDGSLYIIEYGEGWFSKNANAALSVIRYNGGNRPPAATLRADHQSGGLPLRVHFSADGSSDPDRGDALSYAWNFGDGAQTTTDTPAVEHAFAKAGTYPVTLTVTDGQGGSDVSSPVQIFAGNSRPKVAIKLSGNPAFYFPNRPVHYTVQITDPEDGPALGGDSVVELHYLNSPDKAALATRTARERLNAGKALMESLDCASCHKVAGSSIGPAFTDVAQHYKNQQKKALAFLSQKIIKGGSGNWGETAMPAHPDLKPKDAEKIVHWVLALADDKGSSQPSLPLEGQFVPAQQFQLKPQGYIVLSAGYTDKGAAGVAPLSGNADLVLHSPQLAATEASGHSEGVSKADYQGRTVQAIAGNTGWLVFSNVSVKGVAALRLVYGLQQASSQGWQVDIHQDAPDGPLLGSGLAGKGAAARKALQVDIPLSAPGDEALHKIYLVVHKKDPADKGALGIFRLEMRPD